MRAPALILLAAGGSSRMGRPKQLLPWQGRTLLRHACMIALASSCRPVIVVLGCEAATCHQEIEGLDVTTVNNENWKEGMGRSVATGITQLEAEAPDSSGVLLMLVDQPTVTPLLLEALVTSWRSASHAIVAAKYPEGGGVPAVFGREFFPELRSLVGDRGARDIISRESSRVALIDFEGELVDLDTPEIFQTVQNRCSPQGES